MKLLLLASASLAISATHAYDDALSTASLRGRLDFLASPSDLNRISCKWESNYNQRNIVGKCASRSDDKNYPYYCEDGRPICCDASYIDEPNLNNFGKCTRVEGGPRAPRRPTPVPRPTPNRPPTPRRPTNSIHCIAPDQRRFTRESNRDVCDSQRNGNNVPYSCSTGSQLCCTNSKMTNVRLDKFGQCHKIHYPNEVEEDDEDLLEIEHDVEDEKDDIDDEEYTTEEDGINFLDEGAEVKCYGPPGSRPCPEGRIPYTCAAGGEMCCEWSDLGNVQTRKRNKNQRLKDRINLPGYGSCTRDDIPTADSEDHIMIS